MADHSFRFRTDREIHANINRLASQLHARAARWHGDGKSHEGAGGADLGPRSTREARTGDGRDVSVDDPVAQPGTEKLLEDKDVSRWFDPNGEPIRRALTPVVGDHEQNALSAHGG